jgi:hypothetical protein
MKVENLCGSSKVKIIPKHYTRNIIKLKERSFGITATCQNRYGKIMLA